MRAVAVQNEDNRRARSFTVELKSRGALKNASLSDRSSESVLLEGTLGTLKSATFLDGVVLEVVGSEGVLRVDLLVGEILGKSRVGLTVGSTRH